MLYRKIPKTGDALSILGFGAMRLPAKNGRIHEPAAMRQLRSAIDQGVNYIDTAWPYHNGASEPFLGRALGDGYRKRIRLSTKLPYWLARNREDMQRLLAAQLGRLQTDAIDYYLIHSVDGETWEKAKACGAIEFLDQAKREGKIAHAGFSSHGDKNAFKKIVDDYDWEFCMLQFNYLDEYAQAGREGLEYAAARGLGVIVMEPLRGGTLAGRIPPAVQAIWEGAAVRRTPAEWALRWIWNHPAVTVVLSGMNADAQIEENVRIACEAFPASLQEAELQRVRLAADAYRKLMRIGCTGCGYCLPCPFGVNIPLCFDMYNGFHMFGGDRKAKMSARINYLTHLAAIPGVRSGGYASLCTGCGQCAAACPQHLAVPGLIREVEREFEDTMLRILYWVMKRMIPLQRRSAMNLGRKALRSR